MKIKCNNTSCAHQYGGECTVRENIKLWSPDKKHEFVTHCTSYATEYIHEKGELKSLADRKVYCSRTDCIYQRTITECSGECKNKKLNFISGIYKNSECRCLNYERGEVDVTK